MRIGFTGTQQGMSEAQRAGFMWTLATRATRPNITEFHHGDCVGADAQADEIVMAGKGFLQTKIVVHPPSDPRKRAYCPGSADELREPKPYMERNRDIVDETDLLIATPKGFTEELRSGTWATVRYARKQGKRVIIIWPDGSVADSTHKE